MPIIRVDVTEDTLPDWGFTVEGGKLSPIGKPRNSEVVLLSRARAHAADEWWPCEPSLAALPPDANGEIKVPSSNPSAFIKAVAAINSGRQDANVSVDVDRSAPDYSALDEDCYTPEIFDEEEEEDEEPNEPDDAVEETRKGE